MTLDKVVNKIYGVFKEHAGDRRVILLHPDSRYRTALVSRMLVDDSLPVFYYAMGSDDIDIPSFVAGFTHDLADQVPTFGSAINLARLQNPQDLTTLLEGFAQDFEQLHDEPFILLLDEFDRATIGDDLEMLLEGLIDYLPERCRLVISSRKLPRFPWMSLIAQQKAVMLRDDGEVSENFYGNQAGDDAQIRGLAFGPGTVILDGESIDNWEGHLPRLLFFFALERPVVTRSEICRAFWPELTTDQAVNVFHVTKRRLHKAINVQDIDILMHEDGSYRVNPTLSIRYDVTDFVAALVQARSTTASKKAAAWQRVIDLYQHPFLQGHNEPWIAHRRAEYQAGLIEALAEMATIRLEEKRPEPALTLLLQAARENPLRQDVHRRVMSLYSELGRRSEAASHFKKMKAGLDDERVDLDKETEELYSKLMS